MSEEGRFEDVYQNHFQTRWHSGIIITYAEPNLVGCVCQRPGGMFFFNESKLRQLHNHHIAHNPSRCLSEVKTGRGVLVWKPLAVCSCVASPYSTHIPVGLLWSTYDFHILHMYYNNVYCYCMYLYHQVT